MIAYKLTDAEGKTWGGMQWEVGVTNEATGEGNELCSNGVLHCYEDPELALLLNPIHANFLSLRLWEIECDAIVVSDWGKRGSKKQTPLRELTVEVTTEQRIEFAIRCALSVYEEPVFVQWAKKWLLGEDRSRGAAEAAAKAAAEATWAATAEAAWAEAAEAEAAEAAAWAATAEAEATAWAAEAEAAEAAAWAAKAAEANWKVLDILNQCSWRQK